MYIVIVGNGGPWSSAAQTALRNAGHEVATFEKYASAEHHLREYTDTCDLVIMGTMTEDAVHTVRLIEMLQEGQQTAALQIIYYAPMNIFEAFDFAGVDGEWMDKRQVMFLERVSNDPGPLLEHLQHLAATAA
jgi:hypothetical protein